MEEEGEPSGGSVERTWPTVAALRMEEGPQPRNAGGLSKLKKTGKQILP